jgi:voltage-gated potassium channel Kch
VPRVFERTHFYWLTFSLVGLMIAGALSRELSDSAALALFQYTSTGLLFLSLLSLTAERRWARWFVLVVGAMFAMVVARAFTDYDFLEYIYLFLLLVFMLMAAWLVGQRVLLSGSVDLNKIVGSVALYLMIGLVYSILYTALVLVSPQAIKGIAPGPWYDVMPSTTYFSFVTLTTLGYGDMSPTTPTAEVLVVLEAVTGMFYLAIIVASLVGSMRDDQAGKS